MFDFDVSGQVDGKIIYNTLAKSVDVSLYYDDGETDPVKIESKNIVYNYEYVRLATEYVEEDGELILFYGKSI